MSTSNLQTQAIGVANQLISVSNSLIQIYNTMNAIDQAWTDNGLATVLAALGTVAPIADGSTGAADGSPNTGHPISPALYPTLTRTLSSTQITQIKTIADAFVSLINGNAVTAQSAARAILNAAVGA